jgi:hypothetical protein
MKSGHTTDHGSMCRRVIAQQIERDEGRVQRRDFALEMARETMGVFRR